MPTGHCLCGQLRFEARGEPHWIVYCHCGSCRRHTGSPVTCFANFRIADVSFTGDRATFHSSPGVTRSHCVTCGTPIAYETEKRQGEIDLYINVFDEPEALQPQSHAYYGQRLPWFDTRDDLPRE